MMVELKNIHYKIGNKAILNSISFEMNVGNVVAIAGPNGAGKSTLIQLISGDLTPTEGIIKVAGRDVQTISDKEFALNRAYLTQHTAMSLDFPVEEVVMMGRYPHFKSYPSESDFEIVEKEMANSDILKFKEKSYRNLSGGEQQRVQLARTFTQLVNGKPPMLLLLDEPLNNLDLRHQHLTLEKCRDLAKKGNLVIIVMHDLNLACRYADQIALLANGNLVSVGSVSEVFTNENLSLAYDYPVHVIDHPSFSVPLVVSGESINE